MAKAKAKVRKKKPADKDYLVNQSPPLPPGSRNGPCRANGYLPRTINGR